MTQVPVLGESHHVYYAIQFRRVHEGSELDEWSFAGRGSFVEVVVGPWIDSRPKFKESYDEMYDVCGKTGHLGWWRPVFAMRGLKRLRDVNDGGGFMCGGSKDAVRYEFRIVKVSLSCHTTVFGVDDLLDDDLLRTGGSDA